MTPELLEMIRDALLPAWENIPEPGEDIPELANEHRMRVTKDGIYRLHVSAPPPYSVYLNDKPLATMLTMDPMGEPLIASLIQVFRNGDVLRIPTGGRHFLVWERPIPW